MSRLYKECQLRRFAADAVGGVERVTRWVPVDDAIIGRSVSLGGRGTWEIVSAPEPALCGNLVRRFDPDGMLPEAEPQPAHN